MNSLLSISNLMVITEQITEADSKTLVLIIWQKISEYWVNITSDQRTIQQEVDTHVDDADHLCMGKVDVKSVVEKNISSAILTKNLKKLVDGFKKKLGIGTERNEFLEVN